MSEEFYLGQVFTGMYPPEAAKWCNDGQKYHIEETGNPTDELRTFTIVENEVYVPSEEELKYIEEEQQKQEAIANLPKYQEETDSAICELYEMIIGE